MNTPYKPLSLVPENHFQRDLDWPCLESRFTPEPITEARKIGISDWSGLAVGVIPGPGVFGGRPLGLQARTRSLLLVNSKRRSPRKITPPGPWSAGGHRGAGWEGPGSFEPSLKKPTYAFRLPSGKATRGQHPLVVTRVSASKRDFPAGGTGHRLILLFWIPWKELSVRL